MKININNNNNMERTLKKKVLIISGFDTYRERVHYLEKFYSKNYEVKVLLTDFKHFHKEKIDKNNFDMNTTVFINTKPYSKNISFSRIWSHYSFSHSVYNFINNEQFDILHSLIPPNFLTYFLNKFGKKNKNVKIIVDIIDLWPESFPIAHFKNNPFFYLWERIRTNNLKYIDQIVTECNLFKEKIPTQYRDKTTTIYLTREDTKVDLRFTGHSERIDICYLGSVNNIIDINFIINVCGKIKEIKPVKLHIIGDGERLSIFLQKLKINNIDYEYYGKIYDKERKEKIFNNCHFAFNVMKKNVFVGLTMKSIDYFQHGLPLINTIQGDSYQIINNYQCGFNYIEETDSLENLVNSIVKISNEDLLRMRHQSRKVFEELLSENNFNKKLDELMIELTMKENGKEENEKA